MNWPLIAAVCIALSLNFFVFYLAVTALLVHLRRRRDKPEVKDRSL